MKDSELFNLTVVELKSLCSEKGLNAAKLRKQKIVELLIDNGEIPADYQAQASPRKSAFTPRKSIARSRKGILTPQKAELLNESDSLTPTTRSSRYSRFLELANQREAEQQRLSADKENQEIDSESLRVENDTDAQSSSESSKKSDPDEFSDANEQVVAEKAEPQLQVEESNSKDTEDAGSVSSFTTAVSSADNTFEVDKKESDSSKFVTPQKGRRMWSTSLVKDFNFAEDSNPSTSPSGASEETFVPAESLTLTKEQIESSPEAAHFKETPEHPKLLRQETFTIETPASKSMMGVAKASKVSFKASKTPNFKQIHARNQAKFENISDYSARKRDRMKQLLSTTREIRSAGAASRSDGAAVLKTPIRRGAKVLTRMETPASEKKILSNKVRTNRRFELLMKARGLPVDEDVLDDN